MADPIAILSQDTTITVANASAVATAIGGVSAITGLGSGTATEHDTTTLASTAKESRPGLRDFGTVTIDLSRRNHDDVGQAELFSMMGLQATREFVVTLSESTNDVYTFDGYVQSITTDINADGIVTGSVSVRVTGDIVIS